MKKTEKVLRQFLRSSCDTNFTLEPDLKLVGKNGATFAHKFVIFDVLPDLTKLLCNFCLEGHETTTIIIPDVIIEDIIEARDFLYMFGENENFAKLFKMKKDLKPNPTDDTSSRINMKITKKRKQNEKIKIENVNWKRRPKGQNEIRETESFENAKNIFEKRNIKECSITVNESLGESTQNGNITNKLLSPEKMRDTTEVLTTTDSEGGNMLNIVMADQEELIGEQIDDKDFTVADTVNIKEEVFSQDESSNQTMKKVSKVEEIDQICKECGITFDQGRSLRKHVEMEHLGIRYPCDHCEYLGTQIKTVSRHTEAYHPGGVNRYKNISIIG